MIEWQKYRIRKFATYEYKKRIYLDCIFSFDSEVTTFFLINGKWVTQNMEDTSINYVESLSESEKIAIPYIWQLCINGDVIYGRTIPEFFEFIERFNLINPVGLKIIYVHNLGYDFEFLCEYLPEDTRAFARAAYKPIYVNIKSLNIIFKCSYMLTNMSLEKCAKEFDLQVNKKIGQLEYTKGYLPCTPLEDLEMEYCEADVLIIYHLIKDIFLKRYECLADIPLTQTGEVRRNAQQILGDIPNYMFDLKKKYPDIHMYKILTEVLAGGYTHLNAMYENELLDNVTSYDKRSSYLEIMCTRKFPSGKWREIKMFDEFNFEKYGYIFRIKLIAPKAKSSVTYISAHKCAGKKFVIDNGKVFSAEYLVLWATEIDLQIIDMVYNYENVIFEKGYCSYKKYLPKEYIEFMLSLYGDKTRYKNILEKQSIYKWSKGKANSAFGMMLTNTIRDEVTFNTITHLWEKSHALTDNDIVEKLKKLRPFLNFSWGVWVTAYGRFDVMPCIMKVGRDFVYSDTDSVKLINSDKHLEVFERFNEECGNRIREVCDFYNIDINKFYPYDKSGECQPLGYFENECTYDKFISLGSKKYAHILKGELNCTVAGLRKRYFYNGEEHSTINDLNEFKPHARIPHGRLVYWHLTDMLQVELTDYMGNKYINTQKQGIAMLSTFFSFNITKDYETFCLDCRNKYTNYFRGFSYEDF